MPSNHHLPHPLPIPPSLARRPVVIAFLLLILLRSRTITLSKDVLHGLRRAFTSLTKVASWKENVGPEELAKVLQQVYIDEPDGSKTLLVPYRGRVVKVRNPLSTSPEKLILV